MPKRKPAKRAPKNRSTFQFKFKKVMREYDMGTLRSGSKNGAIVKNRHQAIAIALSEARKYSK